MRVAYTIHKTGTPRLANVNGKLMSAGLWWNGTGWGDSDNAMVFDTDNTSRMPVHNGEWVEIYVNEDAESC